jgi:hypothetical protein
VADDHSNVPCSPQPEVQDILREVQEVTRECNTYIFPFRRIRCRTKTRAERNRIIDARVQLYERSQGQCELGLSSLCWGSISWWTMHTCHVISRARGGTWDLENLKAGCPDCHAAQHNAGGKPCAPK